MASVTRRRATAATGVRVALLEALRSNNGTLVLWKSQRSWRRATDAPTRERVARSILENGPSHRRRARRAARPDPGRRPPPPRPPARGGHCSRPREPRAARRPRAAAARPSCSRSPRPGRDHFDQQYDDLAVQALRFLAETGGRGRRPGVRPPPRGVHRGAVRRRSLAAEPAPQPGRGAGPGRSPTTATPPPSARSRSGEQLCQQHCPVAHVAHEFPQLCEAETEVIARLLGRHVQRLATIAHGDGVCTTCIPDAHRSRQARPRPRSTTERRRSRSPA